MSGCPRCTFAEKLDRHAQLVAQGIEDARDGLARELTVDERLDLVAESFELEALLRRIEERRQAVAV